MIGGTVDNMEKYKYMLGQAHAYMKISQEISTLLNPKEQKMTEKQIIQTSSNSETPKIKSALLDKYDDDHKKK